MSEETSNITPEQDKKPTQINLGEVVNNYLEALQRVHDVINYTLASERLLNEQEYEQFSQSHRVMPSQKSRMSYEQAKEETNTWLLKQTLNESLGVLVLFLDDCRTLSTLSTWKSKGQKGEDAGDIQKILQEERVEFARLDLPGKINFLREKHAISSPSEEHIISLYRARKALANKNSIVGDNDTDSSGKLAVKLRSVQLKAAPSGNQQQGVFVTSEVGDLMHEFKQGDRIRLNKQEHIAAILTVAFFITTQAQSLKEFAQGLGVTK